MAEPADKDAEGGETGAPRRRLVRAVRPLAKRDEGAYVTTAPWPAIDSRATEPAYALACHFMQTERWPAGRLAAAQLARATELARFARRTVPFHADRLAEALGDDTANLTAERFAQIPILTRAEVQAAGEALSAPRLPPGHGPAHKVVTSGSSGQPVATRTSRLAHVTNAAATLRGHLWFRRDLMASNVTIQVPNQPQERYRLRAWAPGVTGAAIVYNNRVPVDRLFDWLCRDDPRYLQCHPSILQELIHESRARGRRPGRLAEVRVMGEVLEPGLRRLAREAWGVPVRDNYSCEELGILALECPAAEGKLHVQAERALLEVVDDAGQPVPPGGVGRVLATGLFNYATPLIRYELGDRAVLGGPCRCGRGLPVLDRLVGRERQSVRLPSGARLFPTLDFEPLLLAGGVRQYQVVQTGVEQMRLNLVADRPLAAEVEAAIVERLRHNFGHPFRFDFVYLEAIPRGPGGKFQLFRSELG